MISSPVSDAPLLLSFLDTDLYKLSIAQVVHHQFPHVKARWEFINRGETRFPAGFDALLSQVVKRMADLTPNAHQLDALKKLRWLQPLYLDSLAAYRYNPDEVVIRQDPDGTLRMVIEGPWHRTTFWEVPLLAVISQLYYEVNEIKPDDQAFDRMDEKLTRLGKEGVRVADFGTRRRFSASIQNKLVISGKTCCPTFQGTSNVHHALHHQVRPVGTMAHEGPMAMQVMGGLLHCNRYWMDAWVREYDGDLGIALPDTVGSEPFLNDFTMKYAKMFDGIRQDSGNPFEMGERYLAHYQSLGVDPAAKRMVFSDGLDTYKAIQLHKRFEGRTRVTCGIGTHLTNDCGHPPLNIVLKLTHVGYRDHYRWYPVVKLGDGKGKGTGPALDLAYAQSFFGKSG